MKNNNSKGSIVRSKRTTTNKRKPATKKRSNNSKQPGKAHNNSNKNADKPSDRHSKPRVPAIVNHFTRAAKAGQLIRHAFATILGIIYSPDLSNRLMVELLQIFKSAGKGKPGPISPNQVDWLQLKDFECNKKTRLRNIAHMPFSASVNRQSGVCVLDCAAFQPGSDLRVPEGPTHAVLFFSAAAVDFESHTFSADCESSDAIPLWEGNVPEICIPVSLTPNSNAPILLAWGIRFFIKCNGKLYPCTPTNSALAIVNVEAP